MNHTRNTAPTSPATTGRAMTWCQSSAPRRLTRRAIGCTLLGTLVITGPWTVPAVGHESGTPASTEEAAGFWPFTAGPPALPAALGLPAIPGGPGSATGLYDIPFLPFAPFTEHRETRPAWPAYAEETWTAPVSGHPVSASYGTPGGWAAGYHTGIDWATPVGTPVKSVGPGTVVLAERSGDYGNAVVIEMADGYYTLYAHLSRIEVRRGQEVDGGKVIGDSGNTGRSTGPHLHFEVRADRAYGTDVDPVAYLARHGVEV
ncbi:M23 family metallopeptidase [Streptomyces marincola]|uniref:M23 family metallopeptidase n=1 Tax=Streptomyces marincola TaxID=2878388 RepID=UPI001CF0F5BD|nr:M23 family metallopeptidase [Streptomyces marincola]UCM88078.1 M23 family metallopeptidase [Streptomyces marincola]